MYSLNLFGFSACAVDAFVANISSADAASDSATLRSFVDDASSAMPSRGSPALEKPAGLVNELEYYRMAAATGCCLRLPWSTRLEAAVCIARRAPCETCCAFRSLRLCFGLDLPSRSGSANFVTAGAGTPVLAAEVRLYYLVRLSNTSIQGIPRFAHLSHGNPLHFLLFF